MRCTPATFISQIGQTPTLNLWVKSYMNFKISCANAHNFLSRNNKRKQTKQFKYFIW